MEIEDGKNLTVKIIAIPKRTRKKVVVVKLSCNVVLLLNFAITGIERIAMKRLQHPEAMVASWLFSSESPDFWKISTE
jgi:hypothetical protein